jgi:hypothetical protein
MRTIFLVFITLFVMLGCNQDSPKVRQQKAIYFSLSNISQNEQEREITRTMETQHLSTPGKAMIYLLDKNIEFIPKVEAIVKQAANQAGVQLPPNDPLDEADARIKDAREIQSLLQAREEIARIEAE